MRRSGMPPPPHSSRLPRRLTTALVGPDAVYLQSFLLCASLIRCTSHSCSLCDRSCKVSRFLGTKIGPTLSHLVSFLTNCTLASFNIPNFTQSTARQMQYSMLWHSATKIQRCWFTRPATRFAISAVLMQFTRSHSLPASPRRG